MTNGVPLDVSIPPSLYGAHDNNGVTDILLTLDNSFIERLTCIAQQLNVTIEASIAISFEIGLEHCEKSKKVKIVRDMAQAHDSEWERIMNENHRNYNSN